MTTTGSLPQENLLEKKFSVLLELRMLLGSFNKLLYLLKSIVTVITKYIHRTNWQMKPNKRTAQAVPRDRGWR